MKMRKILATIAAAVVACSAMVTSAFAADAKGEAFLMIADGDWALGNWDPVSETDKDGNGTDATITGDGTYTVSFSIDQYNEKNPDANLVDSMGIQVLCVDFRGFADTLGYGKSNPDYANCETSQDKTDFFKKSGVTISDVSISTNEGELYKLNNDKLLYGDIEGNGNLRLEIYNPGGGGDTSKDGTAFFDADLKAALDDAIYTELSVTFTISGLDGAAADPEPTPDPKPSNPPTGSTAGLALAGLALAGVAVVATKKSK